MRSSHCISALTTIAGGRAHQGRDSFEEVPITGFREDVHVQDTFVFKRCRTSYRQWDGNVLQY